MKALFIGNQIVDEYFDIYDAPIPSPNFEVLCCIHFRKLQPRSWKYWIKKKTRTKHLKCESTSVINHELVLAEFSRISWLRWPKKRRIQWRIHRSAPPKFDYALLHSPIKTYSRAEWRCNFHPARLGRGSKYKFTDRFPSIGRSSTSSNTAWLGLGFVA